MTSSPLSPLILVICIAHYALSFTPDTTGLYERPGEPKFSIDHWEKHVLRANMELAKNQLHKDPRFDGLLHVSLKSPLSKNEQQCYLPRAPSSGQDEKAAAPQEAAPYIAPLQALADSAAQLNGWWTYELCFGKHVRQFHRNADNKVESEFYLGYFKEGSGQQESDYYTESYEAGTPCDIKNNAGRASLVRFRCSEGESTLIADLKEPSSCVYTLDIETPLLCQHPKYRRKQQVSHAIHCVELVPVEEEPTAAEATLRRVSRGARDRDLVLNTEPLSVLIDDSSLPQSDSPLQLIHKLRTHSGGTPKPQATPAAQTPPRDPVPTPTLSKQALEVIKQILQAQGLEFSPEMLVEEIMTLEDPKMMVDYMVQQYVLQNAASLRQPQEEDTEDDEL